MWDPAVHGTWDNIQTWVLQVSGHLVHWYNHVHAPLWGRSSALYWGRYQGDVQRGALVLSWDRIWKWVLRISQGSSGKAPCFLNCIALLCSPGWEPSLCDTVEWSWDPNHVCGVVQKDGSGGEVEEECEDSAFHGHDQVWELEEDLSC